MRDLPSTLGITVLALLALWGSIVALLRLAGRMPEATAQPRLRRTVWALTLGGGAVFLYRELLLHHAWLPLEAHVDGLLLIATLIAATLVFLQSPHRLPGIASFALPLLTVLLAWAICAGWWTFEPFRLDSVWTTVHLIALAVGTACYAIAASAGVTYLYADLRLRSKTGLNTGPSLGSLEAIERIIVRTAGLGFAMLTLGLATGLILLSSDGSGMGSAWWYSSKVLLGTVVWALYALVMNARYAARFRGPRAAWLSIAGLVLLLVTWAVSTALPAPAPPPPDPPPVPATMPASSDPAGLPPQSHVPERVPCA